MHCLLRDNLRVAAWADPLSTEDIPFETETGLRGTLIGEVCYLESLPNRETIFSSSWGCLPVVYIVDSELIDEDL